MCSQNHPEMKMKKKKRLLRLIHTEPQKRVALIGKERCNIVGGIALTCVCVCVICPPSTPFSWFYLSSCLIVCVFCFSLISV